MRKVAWLALGLLLLFGGPGPTWAGPGAAVPIPEYVLKIYTRAIAVGNEVLRFEEKLIFRLENRRPVDLERAAASFVSGRRQVLFLLVLGRYLERRMPPGSPLVSQIQTAKARFPMVLQVHRDNLKKLEKLSEGKLLEAIRSFAQANPPEGVASGTSPLDKGTVEDQF